MEICKVDTERQALWDLRPGYQSLTQLACTSLPIKAQEHSSAPDHNSANHNYNNHYPTPTPTSAPASSPTPTPTSTPSP